jgi:arylsulfatase A-like enzyme
VTKAGAVVAAALLLSACNACNRGASGGSGNGAGDPQTKVDAGASAGTTDAPGPASSIDVVGLEPCTLGHRGILLDLGDRSTRAIYGLHLAGRHEPETLEREGATWTRFRDRQASLEFVALPGDFGASEPAADGTEAGSYVEAHVRGGAAKSVSVYLNGKPVGAWPLVKGDSRVVVARAGGDLTVEGHNDLLLRFNGMPKAAAGEAPAEIDWIHIGRGDPLPNYAAPTRSDVSTNVTLSGVSRRALSFTPPGFARCSGWLPRGGTAEIFGGITGNGDADLKVSVLVDRSGAVTSKTLHVQGNTWERAELPLGELGRTPFGALGALQFEVLRASSGVRVLVGDPAVRPPSPPPPLSPPRARSAVVVVMGSLQPKSLAPYGGALKVPELSALAGRGLVFENHRASSTLPNGAMAALLSGRASHDVGVDDDGAKLPQGVTTIADAARQAGIASAMFTANPMTSAAFGFDRGWGTFVAHGPQEDVPATKVFDEAVAWIEAHKGDRFMVVIHARGGHPPWDISADELKGLGPANYAGGIDPKHGAELLSKARHVPPAIRFGDADRARAWALYGHAVEAHDAALGRVVTALRAASREADTAIVVTSDFSVNETVHVPFGDGEAPEEPVLWIPLVVAPGGSAEAKRVVLPTADLDLARSLLSALELPPSNSFAGTDLFRTAGGILPAGGRALLATVGPRYALRMGSIVLGGSDRREELCDVLIEPACIADVRATHPLATEALTRLLFGAMSAKDPKAAPLPAREPATIDAAAGAALKAWGR